MLPTRLFSETSARIAHSRHADTIRTLIIYAAPNFAICPFASDECMVHCLGGTLGSGHLEIERLRTRDGPIWRLRLERASVLARWASHGFSGSELYELIAYLSRLRKAGPVAVRLNGTSDVSPLVFRPLMEALPAVDFYDYTKRPDTLNAYTRGELPTNYHLTFSWSGLPANRIACNVALSRGVNVAVVFGTKHPKRFPKKFLGVPVVDGDASEYRPADPKGCIVGLTLRGNRNWAAYRADPSSQSFVVPLAHMAPDSSAKIRPCL